MKSHEPDFVAGEEPPSSEARPQGQPAPSFSPSLSPSVSASSPRRSLLQAVLVWHGRIVAYRLLGPRGKLTVGPTKRCALKTPPIVGAPRNRFTLIAGRRPAGTYRIRLTPAFRGELFVGGEKKIVADLLGSVAATGGAVGQPRRPLEVDLAPGDRVRLTFTDAHGLRLEIRYVDPPPVLPRPRLADTEPFLARTTASVAAVLAVFVTAILLYNPGEAPRTLALTKERVAKILPPAPPPPPPKRGPEKKDEEKPKQEAEGQTKKAKETQGRLGKRDEIVKDTVIPKGEKDILRDKVSKVGLLGIIGKERPQGSGLAKLFANESTELEQAVSGINGARVVAGRGVGGLSTTGAGAGGGGTGEGRIYGAGELDTGGRSARGRGRAGPSLAARKEREVKVEIASGDVDEGGGLTKEQVARVVRAHQNAIKFCYEKELQRKPNLGGKIEVYWVIVPDGSVEKSRIAGSTMGDGAVEGCIVRQIKQWTFPRSDGRTVVQSFPFLFKGGV